MSKIESKVPKISEMMKPGLPDKEVLQIQDDVRSVWKKNLSEELIDSLYRLLLDGIDDYIADRSAGPALVFYIETFCSSKYLANMSDLTGFRSLEKVSDSLIERVGKLIEIEDHLIVERPEHRVFKVRGNLGEMICNIMELYFYHPSFYYPAGLERLKKEICPLILPFVESFPWNSSNLLETFVEYSEDPVQLYSDILKVYLKHKRIDESGMDTTLALDMMGLHVDSEDFSYKQGPKVFKNLIESSDVEWNSATQNFFVNRMVLYPLGVPVSIEEKIKGLEETIEFYKKRKEERNFDKHSEKYLKEYSEDLQLAKTNPEELWDKIFQKASKKAAVSKNILKCIKLTSDAFNEATYGDLLSRLLKETEEFESKPKKFPIGGTPEVVFKDIHFKLLVIEELMYKRKELTPAFDLREFAKEYTKREISIESDGYAIIPEALKFFKQLNIPHEKLALVEELYHDCGVDGGGKVLYQIWRFWDPGCGDEVLPISNKAVEDLQLLPNLKKFTGLEHSKPSKKLIKAFEDKGIELVEQEI